MTDARRITVGPIAAAYLEIQQGTVLVPGTDYDALQAEVEALKREQVAWRKFTELADQTVSKAEAEIEALRAENARLSQQLAQSYNALRESRANDMANVRTLEDMWERHDALRQELEAARGLLRDMRIAQRFNPFCQYGMANPCGCVYCVDLRVDAFLTATKAQEVQAEQGDRQEAVVYAVHAKGAQVDHHCPLVSPDMAADYLPGCATPLYTSPQPGPDVRALAASLYQACGAYDMPERILDALSAAANGEPFAHMIDGLLPCVPPSGEDVRALVEALEECAASLAWNCFGECRAIHAGPIMPAAKALDTARAALAAHRQAQRQ